MADPVSKDNLFAPAPNKAEAKSDATTRFAKQIIDTEAKARQAKTERLRAARMAMAPGPEVETAVKTRKKAKPRI